MMTMRTVVMALAVLWQWPAVAALCPGDADGLKLLEKGRRPELSRWLECRSRCAADMDCLMIPGPCDTPRFFHKAHEDAVRELTAKQMARAAECRVKTPPRKVAWAQCLEGVCQAALEDCAREQKAYTAFLEANLPRACAGAGDCKPLFLDPEPCAPPLWFNAEADPEPLTKEIDRLKHRVIRACGYASRNYPACEQEEGEAACVRGLCAGAGGVSRLK